MRLLLALLAAVVAAGPAAAQRGGADSPMNPLWWILALVAIALLAGVAWWAFRQRRTPARERR